MVRTFFSAALLLALTTATHAQAAPTTIEAALRTCGITVTHTAALDQAATLVSDRSSLQAALSQAGYMHAGANLLQISDAAVLLSTLTDRCANYTTMHEYGLSQAHDTYTLVLANPRVPTGTTLALGTATEQSVLTYTNRARAHGQSCGGIWYPPAPPVAWNSSLALAAHNYADWQAKRDITGHVDPTLGTPGDRAARAGWLGDWGENLAYGPGTAEDAVAAWIKSPDHCRNLMNPHHTVMGAGLAVNTHSAYGTFWGELFGH